MGKKLLFQTEGFLLPSWFRFILRLIDAPAWDKIEAALLCRKISMLCFRPQTRNCRNQGLVRLYWRGSRRICTWSCHKLSCSAIAHSSKTDTIAVFRLSHKAIAFPSHSAQVKAIASPNCFAKLSALRRSFRSCLLADAILLQTKMFVLLQYFRYSNVKL
jgi:hypothetical protein